MNAIRRHPYFSALLACTVALLLFLVLTNPQDVSIGILFIPVVLLFLITFCAAQILLSLLRISKTNPRKRRTTALLSGALVTLVMILQSTGGISLADLILLALIIGVATVYVEKF